MQFHLLRIVLNHPDKIRLVHRHFPMDNKINPIVKEPFHVGSANLSLLAIYGTEKGKFWEINDVLFNMPHKGSISIQQVAEKSGLDFDEMRYAFRDKRLWRILLKDISDGIKNYGLSGTPGYIINNQVYLGQIPQDVLKKYIH
jgi:protein-disulfide isomerase